ncbi:MAG: phosphate ABC transporter, permease protein PstA, partial [Limisphaerales bacterium]
MTAADTKPARLDFRSRGFDFASFAFTGVTGLATLFILAILAIIIANIAWQGWGTFSWRFLTGSADQDMFDVNKAGVLPMIIGTALRVLVMTLFVVPVGVITAVYLTEYANSTALTTRVIRGAVNNLAGVPSIVFGLFGLGFFISFIGGAMDAGAAEPHWAKPAILWASLTLAVMTLPLVIVATEESLRAITPGLREA